ncbi:MAG: TIR domain-containing protein [Bacteroidales bacterium]|nr:TIR domain-containing protein [Bacteroidales bacterium]
MNEEKKYFAFISYSHKDKKVAKKLQNFIQGYKIPAKLEKRTDLPKRIGRVFRDEDELVGDELTPQIEEALRQSRYLIVVCSPNSAKSEFVNEEIEYFKSLGGETKILPYIIAGKATTDEDPDCCYAPALRENQKKHQIVGGDAQENGAEAASVKLIAGMLRLEFNTLYDRFRKAEKRKRKIVITAITAFALLMAGITAWILFLYGGLDKAMNDLNKAYEELKSEKAKVEIEKAKVVSEKKAKDEAYEELFATKDTLAIKNLALQSTNRELNLKNLSLQESKSIILAENAMNRIQKGDYLGARRSALEAISLSYSPEAERALRQSWESNSGTLEGHSDFVYSVCWSPDGKYLASCSDDETIKIWDAKSGKELKTLEGHYYDVNSVCWSPDGKYLASGSHDKTVKIWDANSGECILTFEGHSESVRSVCWSPYGKYLASGSWDNTVKIWDAKSGKELKTLEGHSVNVESVCWSPDGKYLASGLWNNTVIIWDAKSGKELKTLEGHSDYVYSICWSPDGKYLASGSYDATVKIWDAKSGVCIRTFDGHYYDVNSVCWSPDGKYLASGSFDKTVKIWDAKSGECIRTLEGHSDDVFSVAWSSDGKYLASGADDETVGLWNLYEEKNYSKLENMPPNLYSSKESPDGRYYADATAGTYDVIIYDIISTQALKTLKGHSRLIFSICWSPDGKYLVSSSADKTVKVWDAKSGICLQTFKGHNADVDFVGFTSDGRKIISKDGDGVILQWDFPPLDELIEKTKKWAGK